MSKRALEKIIERHPWIKDWDPRWPSFMEEPYPEGEEVNCYRKSGECGALKVRDALNALLTENFVVAKEDVVGSCPNYEHQHRWLLQDGVLVYFTWRGSRGKLFLEIAGSTKAYGFPSIVEGVRAARK